MAKMSLGSFLDHYGIHTAMAALAVIVEDEAKDKKRIIHEVSTGSGSTTGSSAATS